MGSNSFSGTPVSIGDMASFYPLVAHHNGHTILTVHSDGSYTIGDAATPETLLLVRDGIPPHRAATCVVENTQAALARALLGMAAYVLESRSVTTLTV